MYQPQYRRPSKEDIQPYKLLVHAHTAEGCVGCGRMFYNKWYSAGDGAETEGDGGGSGAASDMASRVLCESCYASKHRQDKAVGGANKTARGRRFPCRQFVIVGPQLYTRMISDISFNKAAVFPAYIPRKCSAWYAVWG